MNRFLILLVIALTFGCNGKNTEEKTDVSEMTHSEKSLKVYVSAKGEITADGEKMTIDELDHKFLQLSKDSGIVLYSRANGQEDGPFESTQVIELVMKNGLPIKFYTDSTFTQTADIGGQPQ